MPIAHSLGGESSGEELSNHQVPKPPCHVTDDDQCHIEALPQDVRTEVTARRELGASDGAGGAGAGLPTWGAEAGSGPLPSRPAARRVQEQLDLLFAISCFRLKEKSAPSHPILTRSAPKSASTGKFSSHCWSLLSR